MTDTHASEALMRQGFTVRSAEDECGIPKSTGEHWDADEAGDVEIAYAVTAPADRAGILCAYMATAEYAEARREHASFAEALAMGAGFSDREIKRLLHVKDGAVPAGGWKGDAFRFSVPR